MISRRHLIGVTATASLSLTRGTACAQTLQSLRDPDQFGFIGPEQDPEFGPEIAKAKGSSATTLVGSDSPRHDEVAAAFRLMFGVPYGKDHMTIARYFETITEKNKDQEPFNYEWHKRANPLIVGFFSMTNTLPSQGDQTAWCAAFVNFCLYAAGKPTKFSALSGAFRSYGDNTSTPKPGDLVVFQKPGVDGRKGFGHVGFFLSRSGSNILVLGGNQRGNTGSTGAVISTEYPEMSADLELFGFRRVPAGI